MLQLIAEHLADASLFRLVVVSLAGGLILCFAIPILLTGPRRGRAPERSWGRLRTKLHDHVERGFR